jgi:hypothetical protein
VENRDLFIDICARLEATTRDILFLNMGGRITFTSDISSRLGDFTFLTMICNFVLLFYLNGTAVILVMQRPDIMA